MLCECRWIGLVVCWKSTVITTERDFYTVTFCGSLITVLFHTWFDGCMPLWHDLVCLVPNVTMQYTEQFSMQSLCHTALITACLDTTEQMLRVNHIIVGCGWINGSVLCTELCTAWCVHLLCYCESNATHLLCFLFIIIIIIVISWCHVSSSAGCCCPVSIHLRRYVLFSLYCPVQSSCHVHPSLPPALLTSSWSSSIGLKKVKAVISS